MMDLQFHEATPIQGSNATHDEIKDAGKNRDEKEDPETIPEKSKYDSLWKALEKAQKAEKLKTNRRSTMDQQSLKATSTQGSNTTHEETNNPKKNRDKYYEYVVTYVDDILVMSRKPEEFMETLQKTFKMKGVGPPSYHLGADFVRHDNGKLSWGSKIYIKNIISQFQRLYSKIEFSK